MIILSLAVTAIVTASQPCDFMLQATSSGFGNIQEESEESESEESESESEHSSGSEADEEFASEYLQSLDEAS